MNNAEYNVALLRMEAEFLKDDLRVMNDLQENLRSYWRWYKFFVVAYIAAMAVPETYQDGMDKCMLTFLIAFITFLLVVFKLRLMRMRREYKRKLEILAIESMLARIL